MKDLTEIFRTVDSLDAVDKKHETEFLSAKIISEDLKNDADLTDCLATIIVGETLCGARIDEKEYLLIYPSLITVFGSNYSFSSVKKNFNGGLIENNRKISGCASKLGKALKESDNGEKDALELFALVYSYARRLPLRSKLYVKKISMLL